MLLFVSLCPSANGGEFTDLLHMLTHRKPVNCIRVKGCLMLNMLWLLQGYYDWRCLSSTSTVKQAHSLPPTSYHLYIRFFLFLFATKPVCQRQCASSILLLCWLYFNPTLSMKQRAPQIQTFMRLSMKGISVWLKWKDKTCQAFDGSCHGLEGFL